MKTFSFDAVLPGETETKHFRFSTAEKRDKFIFGGCKPEDLEFDSEGNVKVDDSQVINEGCDTYTSYQPPSLSETIDAMMASAAEITKVAIDKKVGMNVIRKLLDAQESLEQAFLYLTDRSYKGID